jgi:hypothetical protein
MPQSSNNAAAVAKPFQLSVKSCLWLFIRNEKKKN